MRNFTRFRIPFFVVVTTLGSLSLGFSQAPNEVPKITPNVEAKTALRPDAPKTNPAAKEEAAPAGVPFTAKDLWSTEIFDRDDNKVLVIQDRKYNKQGRLEFGVDLGMTTASSFFNTYTFGARGAYYLNEYWGIQGFANYSLSTDSEEKRQLENFLVESNFNSSKEFLKPRLFTGLGVLWNPIYGKFAWFRSRIIHFDIYGGLGLSYLTMESEFNKPAAGQGTQRASSSQGSVGTLANLGIRIYLNKNMAWTTEARNNIYKATYQATTTGGGGGNIAAKDVWQNNFQFVTGVSYLFNIGGY